MAENGLPSTTSRSIPWSDDQVDDQDEKGKNLEKVRQSCSLPNDPFVLAIRLDGDKHLDKGKIFRFILANNCPKPIDSKSKQVGEFLHLSFRSRSDAREVRECMTKDASFKEKEISLLGGRSYGAHYRTLRTQLDSEASAETVKKYLKAAGAHSSDDNWWNFHWEVSDPAFFKALGKPMGLTPDGIFYHLQEPYISEINYHTLVFKKIDPKIEIPLFLEETIFNLKFKLLFLSQYYPGRLAAVWEPSVPLDVVSEEAEFIRTAFNSKDPEEFVRSKSKKLEKEEKPKGDFKPEGNGTKTVGNGSKPEGNGMKPDGKPTGKTSMEKNPGKEEVLEVGARAPSKPLPQPKEGKRKNENPKGNNAKGQKK